MGAEGNYQVLIGKLDAFIRKFYLNRLIRGVLYTAAVLVSAYLLFSVLEYRFYFSSSTRNVLLYGLLAGTGYMTVRFIALPLAQYYRLGKVISHKEAARIIGTHFQDIQDKLLNILELREQTGALADAASMALIEAGINQKMERIRPIPFTLAIDLRKNKKYLPYALPPLAVLVFMLFAAPNVLKDSNMRLFNPNTHFEKQAPFSFLIQSKELEVVQYDDFTLKLNMSGNVLPELVAINTPSGTYTMQKDGPDAFTYVFNKVAGDTKFYFTANGYSSKEYTLKVVPKPTLLNFNIDVNYPDYTGLKDITLQNTGDLLVPEGTQLKWTFNTEHTDRIEMFFGGQKFQAKQEDDDQYIADRRAMQNELYKIGIGNAQVYGKDTISYAISVVPDAYPQINAEQFVDSTDDKFLYFLGQVSDDYACKQLQFFYRIEGLDGDNNFYTREENKSPVAIPAVKETRFTSAFDLRAKNLQPGDRVTYYFEVWDNDGVHGSKSTRTPAMQYVVPTIDELQDIKDDNNENIKNKLDDVLKDLNDVQKQTDKIEEKLLDKKELNWEDKKQLENLLQKNQSIQEQVKDLQQEFNKNVEMQKEYLQTDPEILEKQEKLQEMFEEVLPDEMQKLMEEIQQLMEQLNREQGMEEMKKMEMNNEQLENELDRMLELFKQLELEQKMQETVDKLNELAEDQQKLAEETDQKQSNSQELQEKQEELNKQFDDIQQDMKDMQEMNEQLEQKKDLGNTEEQQKQADQQQQQASQNLKQNNKKNASQNQKSAAQKMQEMAKEMQNAMQQSGMEQQQEDMNALRRLIDNLVTLSVEQEDLMKEVKGMKSSNPKFVDLMAQQQKIKEDSKMVEDSLNALAKRIFQISSFITRELSAVNDGLAETVEQMGDREVAKSNLYQQQVMTGYNNLALMLDEVMQQMQEQMAKSMPGSQMCQKPGGSSDSQLPSMSEMQKQLNEQLNKMKGQMEQGKKPGGNQGMSQELAEMAQRQAALRQALQELAEQLGGGNTEDGKLAKQLEQIADKMDQTEEDIVNKRITQETLKRQEEILTRLLEAEESDRQRKQDNERQSNTANEINRTIPPAIEEYLKKRNAELDLYKTVSPDLKPFYKNLVEEYLRDINQ